MGNLSWMPTRNPWRMMTTGTLTKMTKSQSKTTGPGLSLPRWTWWASLDTCCSAWPSWRHLSATFKSTFTRCSERRNSVTSWPCWRMRRRGKAGGPGWRRASASSSPSTGISGWPTLSRGRNRPSEWTNRFRWSNGSSARRAMTRRSGGCPWSRYCCVKRLD